MPARQRTTSANPAAEPAAEPADELHELAERLRSGVLRLARQLRLQDQGELPPTLGFALATVARDGPLTIGELASAEQVAVPTMSAVVVKLEKKRLVRRLSDPADRRICRVEITPAGWRHLYANHDRRMRWLESRLQSLTGGQRAELRSALEVIEALTGGPTGRHR